MVVYDRAGVEEVFDGMEVAGWQDGVWQCAGVGHDAGAVLVGALGGAAEQRGGVVVLVGEAEVVQQFVQDGGVVGLPQGLGVVGLVGWVYGVQPEVELVGSGGGGGGAQLDGFGVVGGVGEVEVDVELVAGAGQLQSVVDVLVEQVPQVSLECRQVVGGEAFAGADGEVECEVAYPAAVVGLDAADPHADHGVTPGEYARCLAVGVAGRVESLGVQSGGGCGLPAWPPLFGADGVTGRDAQHRQWPSTTLAVGGCGRFCSGCWPVLTGQGFAVRHRVGVGLGAGERVRERGGIVSQGGGSRVGDTAGLPGGEERGLGSQACHHGRAGRACVRRSARP
ncbi:hypothetical protein [Streptomyces sp. NPDC020681]|uniref:hypothetical protein n=1 Tax=Streptomyces sp. NPDC020681 TaxID=3365083 RepID=UPI0037A59D62